MDKHATMLDSADVGRVLRLLVHDLRNPTATLFANLDLVASVTTSDDPDVREALDDVRIALGELNRGLEQMSWIGRWLMSQPVLAQAEADVGAVLEQARAQTPALACDLAVDRSVSLLARGGGAAAPIAHVLVANAREHAPHGRVAVRVFREGDWVVVETTDEGRAIHPELRELAFTLAGQDQVKGKADGRYSRFLGLASARAAAESIGARLHAGGHDGEATFRLELRAAR